MPFGNLLSSGINNISRNVQSRISNVNQNLTRGISELQSGLPNSISRFSSELGSSASRFETALSRIGDAGSPINDITRSFQGKLDSLSQANIGNLSNNFINDISNIDFTGLNNSFNALGNVRALGGFSDAVKVLPQAFSNITGPLNQISSAVSNIASIGENLRSGFGLLDAFSSINDFVDGDNFELSSTGASRVKNPLREYASYNYVITFFCLSKTELNSPLSSYRITGPNNIICRSGGGGYDRRVTTFAEESYGKHAEYYIDDLIIETVVSPNRNTGVTQGNNIEFTITEPYSMGQFLEAVQISATVNNTYKNYIEAPFCLAIDFFGIDQEGNISNDKAMPTKYIPIKLVNIEFDVTGAGSKYEIQAVPYNELALTSEVAEIHTDININGGYNDGSTGGKVVDILQKGDVSLTSVINARNESLEEANVFPKHDRYIIMFPTDKQGATAAVNAARQSVTSATQNPNTYTEAQLRSSGLSSGEMSLIESTPTVVIPGGSVYEVLKSYAETDISPIGLSNYIADNDQAGTRPFARPDAAMDPNKLSAVERNVETTQLSETERNIEFAANTNIISIIENVLLNSEYGRRIAETQGEDGLKEWFRIDSQVYLEDNFGTESIKGTPPKIFVYSVVPYFPDEAKILGASRVPSNTEGLKAQACKEYNYFYTGKNEDVLDFNIQFKTAFFQNLFADLGQHAGALRQGASSETTDIGPVPFGRIAPPGRNTVSNGGLQEPDTPIYENSTSSDDARGGSANSGRIDTLRTIAQQFHDTLINSNTDMVNAEMTIWGDPYFIPTSGMGNYNSSPSGQRPNLTSDGTMDYLNTEVGCVINFKTPFDYNTSTGEIVFGENVKQFSGYYSIELVTNTFSSGKFTNDLRMIRRRGQNDEPTGDTDVLQVGADNIISPRNRGIYQQQTGSSVAGSPLNSGGTRAPSATSPGDLGDGLRGDPSTTAPLGAPVGQSGGSLSTITTSKRNLQTQVATVVAENFQGLIDELENDYGYEITSIGGYVDRYIRGKTTKSWHASGIAIDINPSTNPDGSRLVTDLPYPPNGSKMTELAAKYGMGWGGDWTGGYIDAMHFSAATNEGGTLQVTRGQIPRGS